MTEMEIVRLSEFDPLRIWSAHHEELRVSADGVFLRDWSQADRQIFEGGEFFGTGPSYALAIRNPREPARLFLAAEAGPHLLDVDATAEDGAWRYVAELPRFSHDPSGMCYLRVLHQPEVTLLHWELGILAIGPALDLLWRQDLEWNHSLVFLGQGEVWFDLLYDETPRCVGDAPWGFALADGRSLFDQRPPPQPPVTTS